MATRDVFLQILLPIFTLVLGYFLSMVTGYFESRQDESRRRREDKEKAYATISSKLHDLFETYRYITLNVNWARYTEDGMVDASGVKTPLAGPPHDYVADVQVMNQKYDELRDTVYEQSLYLPPALIQRLRDLSNKDIRARVRNNMSSDLEENIVFEEQHVENLWSEAKAIMNDMRLELGLEPYPDNVMKLWR